METSTDRPIIANLLHLSYNLWMEEDGPQPSIRQARSELWFDEQVWKSVTHNMAGAGFNMVVLELGDALEYRSHPEIPIKNAWSIARLRQEKTRLRDMGLELIPKLNFSSSHDVWLGPYARQVSTKAYYKVCRDLIEEIAEIFEGPRYFHLGMDEEGPEYQSNYNYVSSRNHDLFFHDLDFLCSEVSKHQVQPWIFSDQLGKNKEKFLEIVSRNVLQSNGYYGRNFQSAIESGTTISPNPQVQIYRDLEANGYDQVPTFSNWNQRQNLELGIKFARDTISPEHLKGFMHNSCYPMTADYEHLYKESILAVSTQLKAQ